MIRFFEKFKIPTILGLGVIMVGVTVGVVLVVREQIILSRAAPDTAPIKESITFTNIEASSAVLSWQTANPAASFVTFGVGSASEQTGLDDRDQTTPKPHTLHYVTLKNLLPQTEYQLKIITNGKPSEIFKFKTASPSITLNNSGPVIGSVLVGEDTNEGIAYLAISGAAVQSALVKNLGSFLITLTQIRKSDLSDIISLSDETVAKLTVVTENGQAVTLFKLKKAGSSLPVLKVGQSVDLTSDVAPSVKDLTLFDQNKDGQINVTDYGFVLKNKIDLNKDGIFDQKDLDLIQKQINQ